MPTTPKKSLLDETRDAFDAERPALEQIAEDLCERAEAVGTKQALQEFNAELAQMPLMDAAYTAFNTVSSCRIAHIGVLHPSPADSDVWVVAALSASGAQVGRATLHFTAEDACDCALNFGVPVTTAGTDAQKRLLADLILSSMQ